MARRMTTSAREISKCGRVIETSLNETEAELSSLLSTFTLSNPKVRSRA